MVMIPAATVDPSSRRVKRPSGLQSAKASTHMPNCTTISTAAVELRGMDLRSVGQLQSGTPG